MADIQMKMEAFKAGLAQVFREHEVTIKEEVTVWEGGSEEVINVYVDGEMYAWNDLIGILKEAGLLEEQTTGI